MNVVAVNHLESKRMSIKKTLVLPLILSSGIAIGGQVDCYNNKASTVSTIDRAISNSNTIKTKINTSNWISQEIKASSSNAVDSNIFKLNSYKTYLNNLTKENYNKSCENINKINIETSNINRAYEIITGKIGDVEKQTNQIKLDSQCSDNITCSEVLNTRLEKITENTNDIATNNQCKLEQNKAYSETDKYYQVLNSYSTKLKNTQWLNDSTVLINNSTSERNKAKTISYLAKEYTKNQYQKNCAKFEELIKTIPSAENNIQKSISVIDYVEANKEKIKQESQCQNDRDCITILANQYFQMMVPQNAKQVDIKNIKNETKEIVDNTAPKQNGKTLSKIVGAISQSPNFSK